MAAGFVATLYNELRPSYLSRRRRRRIHAVAPLQRGLTRSGSPSSMQTLPQCVFGHEEEDKRPSRCRQDDSKSRGGFVLTSGVVKTLQIDGKVGAGRTKPSNGRIGSDIAVLRRTETRRRGVGHDLQRTSGMPHSWEVWGSYLRA